MNQDERTQGGTMTGTRGELSARKSKLDARPRPKKQAVSWGSLSRTLPERTRTEVVARFRARGGDFARWSAEDRATLADSMTVTEDWLELEHPGWKADRDELRSARRQVESEIWR